MDDFMKKLVDAPLADAMKINKVFVEGTPKKRSSPKRTINMFDTPSPVLKNARDYRERERGKKVAELLDYYCSRGFSAEKIHEYTKIDLETIQRGMDARAKGGAA